MNHAANTRHIEITPAEALDTLLTGPGPFGHKNQVSTTTIEEFFNTTRMDLDTLMAIAWGAIGQTLDADHDLALALENHGSDTDQSHRILIGLASGGHVAGPWISQATSGIDLDLTGTNLFKSMVGALIESADRAARKHAARHWDGKR